MERLLLSALIVTVSANGQARPSAQDLQSQLNGIKADMAKSKQSSNRAATKSTAASAKAAATPQREQDVAQAVRVVNFMALYPVSAADQQRLKEALLAGYGPNGGSYDGIHQVYQQIQKCSSDMLPSAHLRENLWQVMGPKMLAQGPSQQDAATATMLKYNPVVAQANGKVVTKGAVQDVLAARTIVAKTAGIDQGNRAESAVVKEASDELAHRFGSMSAAEQDAWVRGESRYQSLTKLIHAGGQAQNQAVALMKQAHSTANLPTITAKVEDQGEIYVKQHPAGSMDDLIRANNNIMRMGLLANQFTALSARGFK